MRFKITYRDKFWRTLIFAWIAYTLVLDTALGGNPLQNPSSIPLYLVVPAIAVFHLVAMARNYVSLERSAIVFSEWGFKSGIPYASVVGARTDRSQVELRFLAAPRWRRWLRKGDTECVRRFSLQDAEDFAAALRPRLLSQSMLEEAQPGGTSPHESSRGIPTQPGGLRRRALAHLVDGLIVAFIWFNTLSAIALYGVTNDKRDDETLNLIGNMVGGFGLQAIWFLYHWIFTSAGATPGKRLLALAIGVGPELDSPGMLRGLVRTVTLIISMVPLGLGFWWAARNPDRRTWHDRLAGTRVMRRLRLQTSSVSPSPAASAP